MEGSSTGLPAEIPGFYYEPERRRYFRILPNHLAPKNSSFYTRGTVEKIKLTEETKLREAQLNEQRTKRRRIGERGTASSLGLRREVGRLSSEEDAEARREVYAKRLKRQGLSLDLVRARCLAVRAVHGVREVVEVYMGTSFGSICRVRFKIKEEDECNWMMEGYATIDHHSNLNITSLTLTPHGKLISTCHGGGNPTPSNVHIQDLATSAIITFRYRDSLSIWTSACAQNLSDSSFSIGTNVGVHTFTSEGIPYGSSTINSDVFTLSYLPESPPSTLLYGARDGGIRIFDSRTWGNTARPHPKDAQETTRKNLLINHGALVSHLHCINSSLVIGKGPQYCALYDLRYTKHPPSPLKASLCPTVPLMAFEELRNKKGTSIDDGFAVNRAGDIMATVVRDQERVGLFSTITGRELESKEMKEVDWGGGCRWCDWVETPEWARGGIGGGDGLLCLGAGGNRIEKFLYM